MITWSKNSADYYSGVSPTTDLVYELVRSDGPMALWWVRTSGPTTPTRVLTAVDGLDVAKAYVNAREGLLS